MPTDGTLLGALLATHGERPAQTFDGGTLCPRDIDRLANEYADRLARVGAGPSDAVVPAIVPNPLLR